MNTIILFTKEATTMMQYLIWQFRLLLVQFNIIEASSDIFLFPEDREEETNNTNQFSLNTSSPQTKLDGGVYPTTFALIPLSEQPCYGEILLKSNKSCQIAYEQSLKNQKENYSQEKLFTFGFI